MLQNMLVLQSQPVGDADAGDAHGAVPQLARGVCVWRQTPLVKHARATIAADVLAGCGARAVGSNMRKARGRGGGWP